MNTLAPIASRWRARPRARLLTIASMARYALALVAFVLGLGLDVSSSQPQRPLKDLLLPPDTKQICPFAASELADWFQAGKVETDGVVRPPNSLILRSNDCDFFKWATRAFLWVTSTGEGDGMTFESPEFFAVAAPDEQGVRVLSRGSVDGADARGDMNQTISSGSKPVEQSGQPGGGGVLMAQNGSLVYFANHVNDVFAYFMTGVKKGEIAPPPGRAYRVPINEGDLENIVTYAKGKGVRLHNPDTLTIVVKSAWIEVTGLDASKYITINATVPTFDTSDPKRWTRNGHRKALLALVGMHIAGSLRSDAAMIWATFEHVGNAPTGGFSYINQADQTVPADPVGINPDGTWALSAAECGGGSNQARMRYRHGGIEALAAETVGPSNTCRVNAFGASLAVSPAENNTRIIDVNRNSIGKLPRDDVRSNYVLVGATWNLGQGSRILANTTLETFTQENGCMSCHVGNLTTGLNRMWGKLKPLD